MTQIPEMLETGGSVTDSNQWGTALLEGVFGKSLPIAR